MKSTGNNVADGIYDTSSSFSPSFSGEVDEDTASCDYCQREYPESEIHKLISNELDVCIHCIKSEQLEYFYECDMNSEEKEQLQWEIQKIRANKL